MKRAATSVLVVLFVLATAAAASAQDEEREARYLISANPLGPLVGLYSGSFEMKVADRVGLAMRPFYFNLRWSPLYSYFDNDERAWAAGFTMGANFYLDEALEGAFLGGHFGIAYVSIGEGGSGVNGATLSPEITLGYRWISGIISIAPTVGASYSFAFYDYQDVYDAGITSYGMSGLSWTYGVSFALALQGRDGAAGLGSATGRDGATGLGSPAGRDGATE